VLGETLVHGSLNLSCTTLGSIMPPVISGISPLTGSTQGGTNVTIQGGDFSNVTAVYFGSQPAASFQRVSDSEIWANAPPSQTGPVHISVLAYGGLQSAASAADIFTYAYIPRVASISVTPNILWAGESSTVTITLSEPAPSGGTVVTLSVTTAEGGGVPGVTLPPSVSVNAGALSATFRFVTSASASYGFPVITAYAPDGTFQAARVTIYPGQVFLSLDMPYILFGGRVTGEIVVRTPAPASGGLVALATDHPELISVPANVPLAAGSTSASFAVTAASEGTDLAGVTISASYAGGTSTSALLVTHVRPRPTPPPGPPGPRPGPRPE